VPIIAELSMLQSSYYGKFEDNDGLYREVMDKKKQKK
jgi:hypothetical protein